MYAIRSYYAVAGAAHFDIADRDAQRLMAELQAVLPGYLLPRLAREIPSYNFV